MRNASAPLTSAALRTRKAFITLAPVRRAASVQNDGPSSPWSWRMLRCSRSAASITSSSGALTKTPAISVLRRSAAPICSATSGSTKRGLGSWWMSPIAQAPSDTACSASSRFVMPQILTFVDTHLGWQIVAAVTRGPKASDRAPGVDSGAMKQSERAARRLVFKVLSRIRGGTIELVEPDGRRFSFGDPATDLRAEVRAHSWSFHTPFLRGTRRPRRGLPRRPLGHRRPGRPDADRRAATCPASTPGGAGSTRCSPPSTSSSAACRGTAARPRGATSPRTTTSATTSSPSSSTSR